MRAHNHPYWRMFVCDYYACLFNICLLFGLILLERCLKYNDVNFQQIQVVLLGSLTIECFLNEQNYLRV
uniref:Uncharacterized protein n=1 Tax=Pararge aegeria TaxID=116150 RepID=S4NNF1_9NEOP